MKYRFADWQNGEPLPKGWDAADAIEDGWSPEDILVFLRSTVRAWPFDMDTPTPPPPPPVKPVKQEKQTQQEKPAKSEVVNFSSGATYEGPSGWMGSLIHNEQGYPKATSPSNWASFLENSPEVAGLLSFDSFRQVIVVTRRPPWEIKEGEVIDEVWNPRPLRDTDYAFAAFCLEKLNMTPTPKTVIDIVHAVASKSSFDPLEGYLKGLKWDGVERVNGYFGKYLGVENAEYAKIVSRRFLVSSVARALDPGCKVDTMPIIEGPQGLMKSSSLRALFGDEFFSDEISDIGSKDAMIEMSGVWCIEIAEMHRMNNAETNAVKKFLSRQVDRYRPPYGRSVVEVPRRVVLAGTINPDGNPYLKDSTGARRFWPMLATKVDLEGIYRDRDQIWAEAVHLFQQGEKHWVQADEAQIVENEQSLRTDVDVWTDAVARAIDGQRRIRLTEVLGQLGLTSRDATQMHAARIGRIMARLGWDVQRDAARGSIIYVKKEEAPPPGW